MSHIPLSENLRQELQDAAPVPDGEYRVRVEQLEASGPNRVTAAYRIEDGEAPGRRLFETFITDTRSGSARFASLLRALHVVPALDDFGFDPAVCLGRTLVVRVGCGQYQGRARALVQRHLPDRADATPEGKDTLEEL